METAMGRAEVNGTRLRYALSGSGEPLVFIHGFTLDLRMWDAQMEAFTRNYQVLRYDVRGFGESAPPTEEGHSHTDDLKALLDLLGIESAHIVGLSMGGQIAVDFVLDYPDAVRSLTLVDAGLGGYRWSQEFTSMFGELERLARESGIEARMKYWLGCRLFAPSMEQPDVAQQLREMVTNCPTWHLHKSARRREVPAIERLGDIAKPVLIIVGELDMQDFHAIAAKLRQEIPGARRVVLPGVGHMSNMEDPAAFNRVVMDFLAGL